MLIVVRRCSLSVVLCWLLVNGLCCLSLLLFGCWLFVVSCSSFVGVRCLLFLLFVVRCSLFVVVC